MLDFTLNSDVLVRATAKGTGKSDDECGYGAGEIAECFELLNDMRSSEGVKLVLDTEDTLEQEYRDKMPEAGFGRIFVRYMRQEDKVNEVVRAKGQKWNRVNTPLRSTPLHAKDRNVVRVAIQSKSQHIVAYEGHFHDGRVDNVLRDKTDVKVTTAGPARDKIANL